MKKTKPKKEYGYYCDICDQMICKYVSDFKACGGLYVHFDAVTNGEPCKEICKSCARNIAEAVLDEF